MDRLPFRDHGEEAWKHASHVSGFQVGKTGGSKNAPDKSHKESWEKGYDRAILLKSLETSQIEKVKE
mgnify:CR=1 FL=1